MPEGWGKVVLVLSAWFISVSAFGSAYDHWEDLNSPGFVFGVIGTLGTALTALYAKAPSTS